MKKVLHINLGSYPFTIDVDAYDLLDEYFLSLEKHFRRNENPDEIIYDIESRIAELFLENVGENAILTKKDIEEAIKILGKPEDFDDEEAVEETKERTSKTQRENYRYSTAKKLFRDPDNKVISGVCSGLSNYFGIRNPFWIRLAAALLLIFSGGGVGIAYIIMSAVIPKAQTSADKKAMKGEAIDINIVADSVEEEITALSDQLQDWAQSFRDKRKQKRFRRKRRY